MVLLFDDILQASILYGILPALLITAVSVYFIRKRYPELSKIRLWFWVIIIFILSMFLVVFILVLIFILLMSGAWYDWFGN